MPDMKKNLVVKVSPEFHQMVKVYTAQKNVSIQEYIVNLIEKDMEHGKKQN